MKISQWDFVTFESNDMTFPKHYGIINQTELKTFHVYKRTEGQWILWMNARGKTAKQVLHYVWRINKEIVSKVNIQVVESPKK